ncbi:MAG: YwaF family protein [Clostridia bacterium]|nr:YwaF family protein [Clostridia bacterium]
MYSFLHNLLSDKKGGEIFVLFGGWHLFYIVLTLAAVVVLCLFLKNKIDTARKKVIQLIINIAFGLYVVDLFLMPLAYGEFDIEKLPFHACTAMCVTCFLSYHSRFFEKYRTSFVLLGLISNMVYLIYPAGVMWHAVHPLSYRVIQTLIFHSVMTIYGLLMLIYEHDKFVLKKCYRDLGVVICMTLWALLGNYIYNGTSDGYSHFFNWFFVVRDPFYAIPESVAPFIMPFLNIAIFFAAEMAVCLIVKGIRRAKYFEK